MKIIKQASGPSKNPTKYHPHVTKELQQAKTRKMLMEYPSGYPTGSLSTISSENISSKPISHPNSDPDVIN